MRQKTIIQMSKRTEFAISLKLLSEQFKNGLGKVQTQLNNFKKKAIKQYLSAQALGYQR